MTLTIAECAARWTDANRLKNDSEAFRWMVAPTALDVFGTSRTLELANALDGSPDTVHNLAKAQRLYMYLYEWNQQKAILARALYGYVRFAEVWTKHMRYEFSPAECLEFLISDLSNGAMSATIEDIHNPAPPWYRTATDSKLTAKLQRIAECVDTDQPARLRRLAAAMLAAIERISK